MSWLVEHRDVFEVLSYLSVLIGVPLALFQYHRAVRKEVIDREYGTYNALDEKYIDYQMLCLSHPRLDIADVPRPIPVDLSQDEKKQELIAFSILFAILERAFLMYHDHSRVMKKRQWEGWQAYVDDFCVRPNFREAWEVNGVTYDTRFMDFMEARLAAARQNRGPSSADLRTAPADGSA